MSNVTLQIGTEIERVKLWLLSVGTVIGTYLMLILRYVLNCCLVTQYTPFNVCFYILI